MMPGVVLRVASNTALLIDAAGTLLHPAASVADLRLRGTLRALGVLEWIDTAVISAEVGMEKPDPRIFHHACERLGVEPAAALHVGDDVEDDVAGARAAGCAALHWPDDVGSFAELARRLLSSGTG